MTKKKFVGKGHLGKFFKDWKMFWIGNLK